TPPPTAPYTPSLHDALPISSVTAFVAPGGSNDVLFTTNSQVTGSARTNSGGQWLSLTLDGTGSFRFSFPYRIHFAAASGMPLGRSEEHTSELQSRFDLVCRL